MKSVVIVFQRDPKNDYVGLISGIYENKEVALADLTKNCLDAEKWAEDQNAKYPGTAKFTNRYFTVSEVIVNDGTPMEFAELMNFQNTRYHQKFNWEGSQLVPTEGVPLMLSDDLEW